MVTFSSNAAHKAVVRLKFMLIMSYSDVYLSRQLSGIESLEIPAQFVRDERT